MATPAPENVKPTEPENSTPSEPADDLVTSHHSLQVDGRTLRYTAQTGRVVLRKELMTDGKFDGHVAKAEVFLTSYILDDADPGSRPVTFAFNGGPGSSSVWLHLGLFGPRRVVSGDVDALEPPPYRLSDNPDTLLAHSDLVFIDPVATGYSRAAKGEKPEEYHGFTGDVESVGEIIRLWTSRKGRWLSPKFIAGESYGTLRASALAEHLQTRYGMYLNGLMLISAVLDFGTLNFTEGNELPHSLFLPTYASIAHYHGLHGDRSLDEVLREAEEFAERDYPWALARGARLTPHQRQEMVDRVANLTGLSPDYVDRVNLRIEHLRYFTELLRHRRLVVGRLDSRFTGHDADYGKERMSADPSMSAVIGSYTAAFNHYVRADLGYESDLPYEVLSMQTHSAWSYKEFEGTHVSVVEKLGTAMRTNPHLKVHVGFGYTDGATPYFAAEHSLAQLTIPDQLRRNISRAYYPAGHMMYIHEPSRIQQSADLAEFVRAAANR